MNRTVASTKQYPNLWCRIQIGLMSNNAKWMITFIAKRNCIISNSTFFLLFTLYLIICSNWMWCTGNGSQHSYHESQFTWKLLRFFLLIVRRIDEHSTSTLLHISHVIQLKLYIQIFCICYFWFNCKIYAFTIINWFVRFLLLIVLSNERFDFIKKIH